MIRINDDYIIDIGACNSYDAKLDLHKQKEGKEGNLLDQCKTIGYYSKLEDAIYGVYKDMLAKRIEEKECSLQEVAELIKSLNNELKETLEMKFGI